MLAGLEFCRKMYLGVWSLAIPEVSGQEEVNNVYAANELLSVGTTKLANSISSSAVVQQGVKVASLMIETAKANLEKAKTK